jgi:hypothetical protein
VQFSIRIDVRTNLRRLIPAVFPELISGQKSLMGSDRDRDYSRLRANRKESIWPQMSAITTSAFHAPPHPPQNRSDWTILASNRANIGRDAPVFTAVPFCRRQVGLHDCLLASACGCGCRNSFLLSGDTNCLDAQTLVRIESLLAIQTLHKFSCSLADRSSDGAGIDSYRPALGADLTVFIF